MINLESKWDNLSRVNKSAELINYVNNEIKNKNYTRMVEDHLKKVKVQRQNMTGTNEVYFQYLKWVYNKKCVEENHLNGLPCTKLLDRTLKDSLGQIPNNCVHLRASFFIWREQR